MSRSRVALGSLLFAASFLSLCEVSAALPESLKEHNFNCYASVCPANDMLLQKVNGGAISLASLRGKVVVLNFWKIDCPPCSLEKPILERIRQKYAGRGLEIIAVNLFDTGDRLKQYWQSNHFGFTLAFDPENRFSVRKETLRSGMPTSFVMNSNSEAIYEVPGVPTTYVINRNGEVVGNSVGIVNWEEQPFVELLESLLGPAPQMVAQNTRDFSSTAGQGGYQAPAGRVIMPAPAGPPQPAVQAPPPAQTYPPLPFQQQAPPPGMAQPMPGQQFPPPASGVFPSQPGGKAQTTKPAQASRAGKKAPPTKPERAAGTKARPGSAGGAPAIGVSPGLKTSSPGAAQGLKQPASVPQVPQPGFPASAVPAPSGAPSLPPLPPATPYMPGRAQAPMPNVEPDEQGNVMARVPDYGQGAYGGGPAHPGGQVGGPLPPAQAVTGGNPIGGFILDSFGRGRPEPLQTTPGVQAPQSGTPPSSIFGQLNQDFQALGSGIRDTFSRILPSR